MQKQRELFERAIKNGRLAHAYIFTGSEGAGKAAFAREITQMLGAHPVMDVISAGTEGAIAVEEARNIQKQLSLTPVGRAKVAILHRAETLTDAVANSLLKTLEEPPAHSYIFLITNNFYGLLPTIISRAQRINFAPTGSQSMASEEFEEIYKTLEKGSITERLLTSASLAEKETPEIENFLKTAMRKWIAETSQPPLGKKLFTAWLDLDYNLNTKLLLDNLFLS